MAGVINEAAGETAVAAVVRTVMRFDDNSAEGMAL